jgi:hypothetical protein
MFRGTIKYILKENREKPRHTRLFVSKLISRLKFAVDFQLQ